MRNLLFVKGEGPRIVHFYPAAAGCQSVNLRHSNPERADIIDEGDTNNNYFRRAVVAHLTDPALSPVEQLFWRTRLGPIRVPAEILRLIVAIHDRNRLTPVSLPLPLNGYYVVADRPYYTEDEDGAINF